MPKINVYLPDDLAEAVRDAQVPVSAICQSALGRAVREVTALRGSDEAPAPEPAYGPFTHFTPRARAAIARAQQQALERHHPGVGTEHLLLGVLDEGRNLAMGVLAALDIEPDDVRSELIASMEPASTHSLDPAPFTPLAKKVLAVCVKEALGLGHNYVGCEHLLLGLIAAEEGLAGQVLRRMGLELRTTRRAVVSVLSDQVQGRQTDGLLPAATTPVLEEILRRIEAIERRLGA